MKYRQNVFLQVRGDKKSLTIQNYKELELNNISEKTVLLKNLVSRPPLQQLQVPSINTAISQQNAATTYFLHMKLKMSLYLQAINV